MNFFNKHKYLLLYGVNLQKNDIITMDTSGTQYITDKIYKYTIFHRILAFFGKPFKYHNCVRLKKFTPKEKIEHKHLKHLKHIICQLFS